jgi:hypothetical protein
MTDPLEKRKTYGKGWDNWDVDLLISSLAEDFFFDDPALPERVTKETIGDYMASWRDRVRLLGGTGEIGSQDRVALDRDGALISWHWWFFVGTKYEGTAVTRTDSTGVRYERITYYPDTPDFSNIA